MARIKMTIFCTVLLLALCLQASANNKKKNADKAVKSKSVPMTVNEAADKIDQIIDAGHAKDNVKPFPFVSDDVFLRRVYLDIAGRIPTYDEAREFYQSKDSYRRQKLIDTLLNSDAYVSHQFNYWADVLRVKSRLNNNVAGNNYIAWLKQALRNNKPYDKMVFELLTAEGYIFENGAAGYYFRDGGMPLDNMANTTRVFLGTQIGCAQCHDHPFDEWTQHEFYEMAAYTNGISTRTKPQLTDKLKTLARQEKLNPDEQQALRRLIRPLSYKVTENTRKPLKLPKDYKYDDAKPNSVVKPMTIFGDEAQVKERTSPRDTFAKWLTSPDNPRFSLAIANRLWKHVMGIGLIEPVDDIIDVDEAANPQLLNHLTNEIVRLNYDMKAFMRILYHTKFYQRAASREEYDPGVPYKLEGRYLTRLSAEQIWDSLLAASVAAIDQRKSYSGSYDRYAVLDVQSKTPQQLVQMAKLITKDPKALRNMSDKTMKAKKYNNPKFVRASEMVSPTRPGHFLRDFGQSDREMIENANTDPTLTQVLQMINGPMATQLLSKQSLLRQRIEKARSIDEKIDIIFISLLSREPSAIERGACKREFAASKYEAYENIVWALLNTREFVFVQ